MKIGSITICISFPFLLLIKSQGRELSCVETIELLQREIFYFLNPNVFIVNGLGERQNNYDNALKGINSM